MCDGSEDSKEIPDVACGEEWVERLAKLFVDMACHVFKGLQRSTVKESSLPVVAKRPVPKIVRPTPKNALEIQEGLSTVVYRTTTIYLDVLRLVERVGVIEYHGDGMGIRDEELLLL